MSAPASHRPGRLGVAGLSLGLVALFLLADLGLSEPLDPFESPPPIALGSGLAPTGAHCSAGAGS